MAKESKPYLWLVRHLSSWRSFGRSGAIRSPFAPKAGLSRTGLFGAGWSGRRLALIALAALLVLQVFNPPIVSGLRNRLFDSYQQIRPRALADFPVVIVDVDEKSIARLGQWPWPRPLLGDLVHKVTEAGAAIIGFDMLLAEVDRLSPENLIKLLRQPDPALMQALAAQPSNDALLADSLRRSAVVLALAARDDAEPLSPEFQSKSQSKRSSTIKPMVVLGSDPRPFLTAYRSLVRPLPILEEASRGHGIVSLGLEPDGVVRRVPAMLAVGDQVLPALTLEMLRIATGQQALVVLASEAGVEGVRLGRTLIATDQHGRLWPYFSNHDARRFVSAADVLDGRVPPSALQGKVVLFGVTATGLIDIRATPVEPAMAGVEIHAQLLESILSGQLLTRPTYGLLIELATTLFVGLFMVLLLARLKARWSLVAFLSLLVLIFSAAWIAFTRHYLLLDAAYPAAAATLLYLLLVSSRFASEELGRQQVRTAFGRYLSPTLVERLSKQPEALTLGGELRTMTFMFSDIRGFTAISERFADDPVGLTSLINRFLTPMTEVILRRQGTVDKYIGDSVMAFWNAPLDDPYHAVHACQAALDMTAALDALNAELAAEVPDNSDPESEAPTDSALSESAPSELASSDSGGVIELRAGIGLNTGVCVVGNLGSNQRFDYSVLGDAVNLASRLEGLTKVYRAAIIISEDTRALAPDFATLPLGGVRVKGKRDVVAIHALLGGTALAVGDDFRALAAAHDEFLAAFRNQRWAAARDGITRCRESTLAPAALYTAFETRIAALEINPPEPDWDGVYVAESK